MFPSLFYVLYVQPKQGLSWCSYPVQYTETTPSSTKLVYETLFKIIGSQSLVAIFSIGNRIRGPGKRIVNQFSVENERTSDNWPVLRSPVTLCGEAGDISQPVDKFVVLWYAVKVFGNTNEVMGNTGMNWTRLTSNFMF